MQIDFNSMKNDTERKNQARIIINTFLADALKTEFGEDSVIMLPIAIETDQSVPIAKNTVVLRVGEVKNKEGFTVDIVAEISAKIKAWNTTGTKRRIQAVSFDDVLEAVEIATNPKKTAND